MTNDNDYNLHVATDGSETCLFQCYSGSWHSADPSVNLRLRGVLQMQLSAAMLDSVTLMAFYLYYSVSFNCRGLVGKQPIHKFCWSGRSLKRNSF